MTTIKLLPFTAAEFNVYAGVNTENPLYAYIDQGDLIVDGNSVSVYREDGMFAAATFRDFEEAQAIALAVLAANNQLVTARLIGHFQE